MATFKPRAIEFSDGENNTNVEQTTEFPVWNALEDARVGRGACSRRPGMRVLSVTAASSSVIDFDGVNDKAEPVYAAAQFGLHLLSSWTLGFLCNADSLASTRTVFGRRSASPNFRVYQDSTSGGRVVAELTDSGAATTTLVVTGIAAGVTVRGLLLCDAGSLTLNVNGTTATGSLGTGTLATDTNTLQIGANNNADYYDGRIEFVRGFVGVRSTLMDSQARLVNPRAPNVLFDYVTELDANGYVLDRSKFGNHAPTGGSPATTSSFLSVNPAPVQAIAQSKPNSGSRTAYVVIQGQVHAVTL